MSTATPPTPPPSMPTEAEILSAPPPVINTSKMPGPTRALLTALLNLQNIVRAHLRSVPPMEWVLAFVFSLLITEGLHYLGMYRWCNTHSRSHANQERSLCMALCLCQLQYTRSPWHLLFRQCGTKADGTRYLLSLPRAPSHLWGIVGMDYPPVKFCRIRVS